MVVPGTPLLPNIIMYVFFSAKLIASTPAIGIAYRYACLDAVALFLLDVVHQGVEMPKARSGLHCLCRLSISIVIKG